MVKLSGRMAHLSSLTKRPSSITSLFLAKQSNTLTFLVKIELFGINSKNMSLEGRFPRLRVVSISDQWRPIEFAIKLVAFHRPAGIQPTLFALGLNFRLRPKAEVEIIYVQISHAKPPLTSRFIIIFQLFLTTSINDNLHHKQQVRYSYNQC